MTSRSFMLVGMVQHKTSDQCLTPRASMVYFHPKVQEIKPFKNFNQKILTNAQADADANADAP